MKKVIRGPGIYKYATPIKYSTAFQGVLFSGFYSATRFPNVARESPELFF